MSETEHKLGWTMVMVMTDNPTAWVVVAATKVEEGDNSLSSCTRPVPVPGPTIAKFASCGAEPIFVTAAKIFSATSSPTSVVVAVAEVLFAVIKVFVAVTTFLACKKRASSASSKGKARNWARRKKKKVKPTRR